MDGLSHRLFLKVLPVFAFLWLLPFSSYAATYNATPSTFASVFSSLSSGDTLILADGVYSASIRNVPSGTASAYTTIKAANDGGATVQLTAVGSAPLTLGSSYVRIEGIKFSSNIAGGSNLVAYISGNHNKILRCGFVGTPTLTYSSGNDISNTVISGSYNLLEDCWAWGGGRYKFLVYGGDGMGYGSYNILRRCVARHDRENSHMTGSSTDTGNPQAPFCNYMASHNLFQNCIAIDNDQPSYYQGYYVGPWFLEKGQQGAREAIGSGATIEDSIALNSAGPFVYDAGEYSDSTGIYATGNVYVSNSVAWKTSAGFQGAYDVWSGRTLNMDHTTLGNITGPYTSSQPDNGAGFSGGVTSGNSNAKATNNIFYKVTTNTYDSGIALYDATGANDYNSFYANTVNRSNATTGAHDMTGTNPLAASLMYLPRIESGTALKGAGSNGSDIGATILYRRGVSGTAYGEAGYDTLTATPLWPWPNEARIKADLSSYPSNWPSGNLPNPVRGFTYGTSKDGSSQTLTKYIWEYLGNQIPSGIYGSSTGSGSTGTTGTGSTTTTTDTTAPTVTAFTLPGTSSSLTVPISQFAATDNVGVTGYCVTTTNSNASCSWSATAPASVTFAAAGAQNAYAWAKDGSNNISAALSAPVTITIASSSSTSSTGKVYYVRPDGHDTASGLSNSTDSTSGAWLTLQKAANVVAAGDTVNVVDGNYAGFMLQSSGSASAPITFHALGAGANITTRNAKTADGINIESYSSTLPSYVVIDGFNVYNQPRMGIRAIGGSNIVIKNCNVHNNVSDGIFSSNTPYIQVLNNTTYKNGSVGTDHNIYVSNALSDNCVIRGNTVYSANGGNGIQLNGDWQSGGDGYITNALIENNVVYNNYNKGLSLISVQNGTFRNNIIYGNGVGGGAGGIHLVDQLGQNFSTGNTVVNNTIDEPRIACVRINSGSTNNVVFDNICIGPSGVVFEGSGNYQGNNYVSSSGSGLFANYSGHDYHLVSGSKAIDYGVATYQWASAPGFDMIGTSRPQGGGFDAGAYEYVSTTPTADTTAPAVTAFTMPSTATSLTVPVTSFSATDNVAVTGYLVTATATAPTASTAGWASTAPASYTFAGAGSRTAYAWAKDAAGNVSGGVSAPVTITLPDTTAPTVSVTAPVSGATVSGTVTVSAGASDNVGVSKIEIYKNGVLQTVGNVSPLSYGWDTTADANGSATITAKAYDAAGNVTQSSAATVTVNNVVADTTAPTVAITTPAGGTTVTGTASVTASASDNVGVSKVEFYVDGALKSTSTAAPYSYSWGTTSVANGTHTLSAKAYDAAGNVGQSAAVSVNVSNTATATAPIAFVQVASSCPQSATQTVTVGYPYAQKAGGLNIVVVGWNDTTNTVQSVKDSAGNVYTLAAGQISGSGLRQSIYYAKGIIGTTNKVTVTFSGSATYPDIRILEYSGLSGVDKYVSASGSGSTSSSGSVTTTSANELLFAANTVSSGTGAAGSGYTNRVITSPDGDLAEDRIVSSTGTYSASAPLSSSGNWVMQLVTFK